MIQEEMLDRMPAEEFYQWMVLEKLEPFGEYGAWLRSGLVASTIANVNRGKDSKPFKPQDFMPQFEVPKPDRQSPRDMLTVMKAVKATQDSVIARRKKREESNASSRRDRALRSKAPRPRVDHAAKVPDKSRTPRR